MAFGLEPLAASPDRGAEGGSVIVHVAAQQSGGAGIAALRLHRGLRELGEASSVVTASGTADTAGGVSVLPKMRPTFFNRVAAKFGAPVSAHERWQAHVREELDTNGVFTSSAEGRVDLTAHATLRAASVINLHWTAGLLDWATFFQTETPIVWTLHDMNPFMGIFHYEVDRQHAGPLSRKADDETRQRKQRILEQRRQMTVVCPSRWLSDAAARSDVLGRFEHIVIPNGVETRTFRPLPQAFSRDVLCLPQSKRLLLLVAERLSDFRKGFDLTADAIRSNDCLPGWEVVAAGSGEVPDVARVCHRTGSIADERLMALLYNAADLTVISSREDNLPNVILESLTCGTPVVVTPAGGMPEPISPGVNGLVSADMTAPALAAALNQAAGLTFDRERIARDAANQYALRVQAEAYREVYNRLAPQGSTAPASQAAR
jgi:glycosyltransferase involved in cell wall biosynthesis